MLYNTFRSQVYSPTPLSLIPFRLKGETTRMYILNIHNPHPNPQPQPQPQVSPISEIIEIFFKLLFFIITRLLSKINFDYDFF